MNTNTGMKPTWPNRISAFRDNHRQIMRTALIRKASGRSYRHLLDNARLLREAWHKQRLALAMQQTQARPERLVEVALTDRFWHYCDTRGIAGEQPWSARGRSMSARLSRQRLIELLAVARRLAADRLAGPGLRSSARASAVRIERQLGTDTGIAS